MWPWGHLAVGYLLYTIYTRYRHLQSPEGFAVVALAIGTQFPDVVDKPLTYSLSILPEGRSLAHSLLLVVPICTGLLYLARRRGRTKEATAFVIGYLSHPLADGLSSLFNGNFDGLTFLLWPILPAPDYPAASFDHHVEKLVTGFQSVNAERLLTGWGDVFVVQFWLFALVVVLWLVHGLPPLPAVRRYWKDRRDTTESR